MSIESSMSELHMVGLPELRKKWGWFVGLGAVLVVGGRRRQAHADQQL